MASPIASITPESERAEIAGWVHEVRDLGGLTFCLVRDRTGIVQVTVNRKKAPAPVLAALSALSRESVVSIGGTVKAIAKAPGGREIIPDRFEILATAGSPLPLDVVEKVPAELDTRLDSRFLDLRRPRVAAVFLIRSAVMGAVWEFLSSRGFVNIATPKLVAAATEGGTDLFPVAYFEKEAFLNQSPQLYKQMMMAAGFERVFEIGPIFRAEEHNTTKHLNEATSIDVEVSYADDREVMELLEDLIISVYQRVAAGCRDPLSWLGIDLDIPTKPFPRLCYRDAIGIAARRTGEPLSFGDDFGASAEKALGEEMGVHYFIVDWPTAIKPYYAMPCGDNPELCRAFDLMHPRMELASGSPVLRAAIPMASRYASRGKGFSGTWSSTPSQESGSWHVAATRPYTATTRSSRSSITSRSSA